MKKRRALLASKLNLFDSASREKKRKKDSDFSSLLSPRCVDVRDPQLKTLFRSCMAEEECNEPLMYVSSEFLIGAWRTIYWCSFALTWYVLFSLFFFFFLPSLALGVSFFIVRCYKIRTVPRTSLLFRHYAKKDLKVSSDPWNKPK